MSRFARRLQRVQIVAVSGSIQHGEDIKNDTNLVGLQVATTRTLNGYDFDSVAAFNAFGQNLTGTGSIGDPYVIDRVRFTSDVIVASWDGGSDIVGKYVEFRNCRFEGVPSNPTNGGTAYLSCTRSVQPARVSVFDSTLGTLSGIDPTGGSIGGGTDKGIQSYCPVTVQRCNIYGACILVYLETEQSESTSYILDNWLHDIWSSAGDHTDIINGNFHASHVECRRNFMDGIRTGNTYVVNGFGIYDDPVGVEGIITDWTLDANYVDRCQTMLLSSTSTARFTDPFVVTDNIWTTRFTITRFSSRTPSTQSGNRDENAVAIVL